MNVFVSVFAVCSKFIIFASTFKRIQEIGDEKKMKKKKQKSYAKMSPSRAQLLRMRNYYEFEMRLHLATCALRHRQLFSCVVDAPNHV